MPILHADVTEGLHCASCVRRLEAALDGQPGISEPRVDLLARQLSVRLDGMEPHALIALLASHGFVVRVQASHPITPAGLGPVPAAVVALALAAACMAWAMFAADVPGSPWVQAALALAVLAWPGRPLLLRALAQALRLRGDMDVLVALGALAAGAHGLTGLVLGWPHSHVESAAAIVAFTLVGRALEARGRAAAGEALTALLARQPQQACRLTADGAEERVAAAVLSPGDRIRVGAGDAMPADGVVESGVGEVDEGLLSGEPLPVAKRAGSAVHAGTLNLLGTLEVRVTATGEGTRLAAIAGAMRQAAAARPPIARLADRVAAVFVPVAIGLAVATWLGWWLLGGDAGTGLIAAISVLVISCPCALGLATPAALTVAVGRAARAGVLVRDGVAIEALTTVRTVVLDKTGTLTTGRLQLAQAVTAPGCDRATLLRLAAAAETGSSHPVAEAVRQAAQGLDLPRAEGVEATPGGGVRAVVEGGEVAVGSRAFLAGLGVAAPPDMVGAGLIAHVAAGRRWIGALRLGDGPRPEAAALCTALVARGLQVHLATGDREAEAQRIAGLVGVGHVHAALTPEGKAALVATMAAEGRPALAVGDGINDAPMLARAAVGAAVGGGADIAALAGHLVLPADRPLPALAGMLALSRATMGVIRANLVFAAGYNLLAIPLAASGRLDPMWAAAAMAASSLCVVGNSLRLTRFRWPTIPAG